MPASLQRETVYKSISACLNQDNTNEQYEYKIQKRGTNKHVTFCNAIVRNYQGKLHFHRI